MILCLKQLKTVNNPLNHFTSNLQKTLKKCVQRAILISINDHCYITTIIDVFESRFFMLFLIMKQALAFDLQVNFLCLENIYNLHLKVR